MKKLTTLLLLCLGLTFSVVGQDFVKNELIVKTQANIGSIFLNETSLRSSDNFETKLIWEEEGLYRVRLNESIELDQLIKTLKKNSAISYVSKNYKISLRKSPNDQLLSEQSYLDLINVQDAWDITTGGISADGKEIVIAVIDDGYDLQHEDLIDNIWVNEGEIAGDGLDNDGNGYTDDYYGLNSTLDNDQHSIRSHGTGVLGIIGAKGDNGIGISGINWNVKIMNLSSGGSVADIIETYKYILQQRRAYNESNGLSGAYVVASNSSFGIDNVFASQFPNWCQMYEDMGAEGIVSVVATSNTNKNIDMVGDMPSTCTSKYLIAVTNVNDQFDLEAAFGSQHIDLAAPGDAGYSTNLTDSYNTFTGTSAACPMVTGAIGLMYSLNASAINSSMDPSELACLMKESILSSVDSKPSLANITVSGGSLNIRSAFEALIDCGNDTQGMDLSICSIWPNPTAEQIEMDFISPSNEDYDILIHNELGKLIYSETQTNDVDNANYWNLDINHWHQGIYFITVLTQDHKSSIKFIKT